MIGRGLLAALTLAGGLTFARKAAALDCVGDCNGDGRVTTDELVVGVNFALGAEQTRGCPASDANADGRVTVNELVAAVNNALEGCPISALAFRRTDYPAHIFPMSAAIADFSGDGWPDIAISIVRGGAYCPGSHRIQVFFNGGDGTFGAAQGFPVAEPPDACMNPATAAGIVAADLNNDGWMDVVTGGVGGDVPDRPGDVRVLLGEPGGTFGPAQSYAMGVGPVGVAVADLNGDGRLDLVTVNDPQADASHITVRLASAAGGFEPPQFLSLGRPGSFPLPRSIVVADLDGDARPDIVTASRGNGNVGVLLAPAAAGSDQLKVFAAGSDPRSVAVADLNGDGLPDLVTANFNDDDISVFLAEGEGGFGPPRSYRTAAAPVSVAVGDMNGDGRPDVVTAGGRVTATDSASDVAVLLALPGGGFGSPRAFAVDFSPASLAVRDLNGDGRLDIVTANSVGATVSVLLAEPAQ